MLKKYRRMNSHVLEANLVTWYGQVFNYHRWAMSGSRKIVCKRIWTIEGLVAFTYPNKDHDTFKNQELIFLPEEVCLFKAWRLQMKDKGLKL